VRILESNDRVAARMCGSNGNQVDDFTIHTELQRCTYAVGDDRVSRRIPGRSLVAVGQARRMNHLLTQLFPREDDDSHSAEERIAGSVIAMDVRIRHET